MSFEKEGKIVVELTKSEALVLYNFLYTATEHITFEHYSEKKILWQLQGNIETKLGELFQSNFLDSLEEARKEVQGDDEVL